MHRITAATVLFLIVLTARILAAPPMPASPPSADENAPVGGWKLTDLTETMQPLRGRSYTDGKRLFARAHCTTCHRQDNIGNEFGPDLTKLDPRFQPLDILRDILDPSRRIADAKFDTWHFETDSGKILAGLILQETDRVVKVMEKPLASIAPTVLDKSEIANRRMSLVSVMPQGMLDNLTRAEIADLVAYIAARGDATDPVVQTQTDSNP